MFTKKDVENTCPYGSYTYETSTKIVVTTLKINDLRTTVPLIPVNTQLLITFSLSVSLQNVGNHKKLSSTEKKLLLEEAKEAFGKMEDWKKEDLETMGSLAATLKPEEMKRINTRVVKPIQLLLKVLTAHVTHMKVV